MASPPPKALEIPQSLLLNELLWPSATASGVENSKYNSLLEYKIILEMSNSIAQGINLHFENILQKKFDRQKRPM